MLPDMATRPFRRRRLGRELASSRKDRNLTGEQAAKLSGIAASSITRIEGGKFTARVSTVKNLLDVYEVSEPRRGALLSLARDSGEDVFWQSYTDVLAEWFELYVDLEAEASSLAVYDAQFINGLAQTEAYMRAMFAAWPMGANSEEIDRRISVRLKRQERVLSGSVELRLVLTEAALDRHFGDDEVMREQYAHLAALAARPSVSVQVLPNAAPVGVLGSFTILDFAEPELDPSVVYIEHETAGLYLEKPAEIRQYARVYDRLRAAARDPEASVVHIARRAKGSCDGVPKE
jgi:transcriptional regulator with XRE-family HTH domain